MNLTIDLGNTQCKMVVFEDTRPVYRFVSKVLKVKEIHRLLSRFPIEQAMISSVVKLPASLDRALKKIPGLDFLSHLTTVPVINSYTTPETLGTDRLANAVAGAFLFPSSNVLVVDCGTCIKYDFVNSRKQYRGGSISPGMEMRFRALHSFTGKLPLVHPDGKVLLTGDSTTNSILSGVMAGTAAEIKGIIENYKKKYKKLKVVITGGDANRFVDKLNLSIFAAADLVNLGLNEILRYHSSFKKKKIKTSATHL